MTSQTETKKQEAPTGAGGQVERVVRLPWPDTDYPPSHVERIWGVLTTEESTAEAFIKSQVEQNVITKEESVYILSVLLNDVEFIDPAYIRLMRGI